MAKKRRQGKKSEQGYQRCFTDDDFAWLAEQFQKQVERHPDLTLEVFAARYGVESKWIRNFVDTGWRTEFKNTVTVWHGTTVDRARTIIEEGFKAPGRAAKKDLVYPKIKRSPWDCDTAITSPGRGTGSFPLSNQHREIYGI